MSSVGALTLLHRVIYRNNLRSLARMIHIWIFFEWSRQFLSLREIIEPSRKSWTRNRRNGRMQSVQSRSCLRCRRIDPEQVVFLLETFQEATQHGAGKSLPPSASSSRGLYVSQGERSCSCSVLDTAVCNFIWQVHISSNYPTTFHELQFNVFVCKHPIAPPPPPPRF